MASPASAGGREGHGGEAIVCKDGSVEFYDVYEAKTLHNLALNLGDQTLNVSEKVRMALDGFSKQDSKRAAQYQAWADSFQNEANIGDFDVAPIDDANLIALH